MGGMTVFITEKTGVEKSGTETSTEGYLDKTVLCPKSVKEGVMANTNYGQNVSGGNVGLGEMAFRYIL